MMKEFFDMVQDFLGFAPVYYLAIIIFAAVILVIWALFRKMVTAGGEVVKLKTSSFLHEYLYRYRSAPDYEEISLNEARAILHECFHLPYYLADSMSESFWCALAQLIECFLAIGYESRLNVKFCAGCLDGMARGQDEFEPLDMYYWIECTYDEENWIIQVNRHLRSSECYFVCIDEAASVHGRQDMIDVEYSYDQFNHFIQSARNGNSLS